MTPRYRLLGSLACAIVALNCFGHEGGELQLPYWVWVVCGVWWLFHALGFLIAQEAA